MRIPNWLRRLLGLKEPQPLQPQKVEPPAPVEQPKPVPKPEPQPPRKRIPKKCMQTGKRCYAERDIAARERDRLAKNTPNGYLRIYTCEFCGYWHLTHKKRYKW